MWHGRFAVCGISDDTCASLAIGAPTGKFHRGRKIYQIPDNNFPQLPLNLWDWICCNKSSFEFELLAEDGIMHLDYGS